uniref:Transactivator protein n=1 Tax=Opuntia virus 1 TaxID=2706523 RepID=A0A6C0MA58_9GEMI|nr:transactivator protein [Opuntia virus 1]QHU79424.1 transactivator protein [Opuntia virus 1]
MPISYSSPSHSSDPSTEIKPTQKSPSTPTDKPIKPLCPDHLQCHLDKYIGCPIHDEHLIHRNAKKRKRRPRRLAFHLSCGCTFLYSKNCGHGFSHRGSYHSISSRDWDLHMEGPQSPIHETIIHRGQYSRTVVPHPNTGQPQPAQTIRPPQMLDPNRDTYYSEDSDWEFILD